MQSIRPQKDGSQDTFSVKKQGSPGILQSRKKILCSVFIRLPPLPIRGIAGTNKPTHISAEKAGWQKNRKTDEPLAGSRTSHRSFRQPGYLK